MTSSCFALDHLPLDDLQIGYSPHCPQSLLISRDGRDKCGARDVEKRPTFESNWVMALRTAQDHATRQLIYKEGGRPFEVLSFSQP